MSLWKHVPLYQLESAIISRFQSMQVAICAECGGTGGIFSKCSTLSFWSTTARQYENDKNLWSVWILVHMTVKHLENKQVWRVWASLSPHIIMSTITTGEHSLLLLVAIKLTPSRPSHPGLKSEWTCWNTICPHKWNPKGVLCWIKSKILKITC
jgi:hypothetical protein